LPFW